MGIIERQAIKGTIFLYLGAAIGFAITIFLSYAFSTEQNGLLKLLISYSLLFAQFGTLGFNNVSARLFPYFRDKTKQHNGFFFILLLVLIVGFILTLILFLILKPLIIKENIDTSPLFVDYIYYILPLLFFTLMLSLLDRYYTMLYNAVIGIFLKEFLVRVFVISFIVLFYIDIITFPIFVGLYIFSYCSPAIIIFISLWREGEISFKPQLSFIGNKLGKSMASVSFFGLLVGFSTLAVLQIDSIMIGSMIGLSATGIYAITFHFGTMVKIPSRALMKISGTIVADAWKNNDLKTIDTVYSKSCLNQFIIALYVFLGIWVNIHNVFDILPPEYEAGKWVIFFIGLTNVIDMLSGGNIVIISTSRHYRVLTLFMFILLISLVLTNYFFIPWLGITGAAIASSLSALLNTGLKVGFIWKKYKMQPYNFRYLIIIAIGVISYFLSRFIPVFDHFIIDIIIRSSIFSLFFIPGIYYLKLSDEINQRVDRIFKIIFKK